MEGKIKKRPYDFTLVNVISVHAFKLLKYMTVKQKLNHIALIWLKPQHTKTIDKQIYRLYLPVYLLRCQYCIPSMYNEIIVSSCWDFAVSNAIMTTKNNGQVAQRLIKMPKMRVAVNSNCIVSLELSNRYRLMWKNEYILIDSKFVQSRLPNQRLCTN